MAVTPAQSVSLQSYSGMATPATAAYLMTAGSVDELVSANLFAREHQLELLVLGEGSNTVFKSDFDGLVVINQILGLEAVREDAHSVRIRVGAGEHWHALVKTCVGNGWNGIENLALIPGLVGAAPIQNIGAYGVELSNVLVSVDILNTESLELQTLSGEQCRFAYRDSIFKGELKGTAIVTAIELELSKRADVNLSYAALGAYFGTKSPSPRDVFNAVCAIRSQKLPLPSQIPNCGSFFKNPVVPRAQFEELKVQYPNLIGYPQGEQVKLAAGWLIEQAGWKTKSYDGVTVHTEQALVITNPEHRSGESVYQFSQLIKDDIQKKFCVTLEIEPILV